MCNEIYMNISIFQQHKHRTVISSGSVCQLLVDNFVYCSSLTCLPSQVVWHHFKGKQRGGGRKEKQQQAAWSWSAGKFGHFTLMGWFVPRTALLLFRLKYLGSLDADYRLNVCGYMRVRMCVHVCECVCVCVWPSVCLSTCVGASFTHWQRSRAGIVDRVWKIMLQ